MTIAADCFNSGDSLFPEPAFHICSSNTMGRKVLAVAVVTPLEIVVNIQLMSEVACEQATSRVGECRSNAADKC
jgi:hypothetical protein